MDVTFLEAELSRKAAAPNTDGRPLPRLWGVDEEISDDPTEKEPGATDSAESYLEAGPTSNTPILVCDSVSRSFGGVQALKGVSISIGSGEVFGLVGPNGS